MIGGDFNLCAMSESNNVLVAGLISAGFQQLVQEATHIEGRTIDHCYIRNNNASVFDGSSKSSSVSVRSVYFSDHDAIILTIPRT